MFQFLAGGEVAHSEDFGRLCRPRRGSRRKCLRDRAADDHLDHLLLAEVADRAGRDMAAIAHNCQPIAERANFPHPMRDEDDGHALAFEAGDQVAEPVDVAAGKSRCRLVEQDQARLAKDSAGDLDLLLHGEIEAAHLGVEVDIEAQRGEMFAQRRSGPPAADHADRPHRRIGQKHVVQDGQVGDQRHFLEGSLNAECVCDAWRTQACRLAEDLNAASVRQDQSGEKLDDGGFAGAVLAEQRVHASLSDRERDVVDCDGGAEGLAQIGDGHRRIAGRLRHISTLRPCGAGRASRRGASPRLVSRINARAGRRARRSSRSRASVPKRSRRTSRDC